MRQILNDIPAAVTQVEFFADIRHEKPDSSRAIRCNFFLITFAVMHHIVQSSLELLLREGGGEIGHFGPVGQSPADLDDAVERFVLFGEVQKKGHRFACDFVCLEFRAEGHVAYQFDECYPQQSVVFDGVNGWVAIALMLVLFTHKRVETMQEKTFGVGVVWITPGIVVNVGQSGDEVQIVCSHYIFDIDLQETDEEVVDFLGLYAQLALPSL